VFTARSLTFGWLCLGQEGVNEMEGFTPEGSERDSDEHPDQNGRQRNPTLGVDQRVGKGDTPFFPSAGQSLGLRIRFHNVRFLMPNPRGRNGTVGFCT
jgi:hypothetical protein